MRRGARHDPLMLGIVAHFEARDNSESRVPSGKPSHGVIDQRAVILEAVESSLSVCSCGMLSA